MARRSGLFLGEMMKYKSVRSHDDRKRFWQSLVAALETALGVERFGSIVADVRSSGVNTPLPLAVDADVERFFGRLGCFAPVGAAPDIDAEILLLAESIGRTPAMVSVLVRMYAAGLYGIFPEGICGNPPHCSECGVTKFCAAFHAPRSKPDRSASLRAEAVLRGEFGSKVEPKDVLALILGGGRVTPESAVVASDLLERYGSLRRLTQTTLGELERFANITPGQAARVAGAAVFARMLADEKRRLGAVVRSGQDFFDLYHERLRDETQESFFIILLDAKNRIMRDDQIAKGTLESVSVSPRDVFSAVIREGAFAVVCIHNHPSGDPTPSPEDELLTERLSDAAQILQIRFLDHVIIGDGAYVSFMEEGIMPE